MWQQPRGEKSPALSRHSEPTGRCTLPWALPNSAPGKRNRGKRPPRKSQPSYKRLESLSALTHLVMVQPAASDDY